MNHITLHASIQHEIDSPDWVKKLSQAKDPEINQLFVVAGMSMETSTASVSMHQRDANGKWKQILSTPAFIGLNGMCTEEEHSEGISATPIGVYHFNKAFGIADNPGCAIPYIKVDNDTYWSGDDRYGMHYNEMIDIKDFPNLNKESSEHIIDYEYQYQYCLNISFNENAIPRKGSAIFLHCLGATKPYSGGCIAIPEYIMIQVMQRVKPNCVVVIDTANNLNATF